MKHIDLNDYIFSQHIELYNFIRDSVSRDIEIKVDDLATGTGIKRLTGEVLTPDTLYDSH